jgi:hypothetical protein
MALLSYALEIFSEHTLVDRRGAYLNPNVLHCEVTASALQHAEFQGGMTSNAWANTGLWISTTLSKKWNNGAASVTM